MAAARRASRRLRLRGLAYLLLFAFLSVSLGDRRNGPFRMRENLWATANASLSVQVCLCAILRTSFLCKSEPNNSPEVFSPVLTDVLEEMKDLLTRELLKILLQERILEQNRGKRDLKEQELSESFPKSH
uniref:Uncharacterized protein n=1 Tax=Sphaerodactylus townsendi TaxID=933632 RepID=A0ACB8E468_9SAUR